MSRRRRKTGTTSAASTGAIDSHIAVRRRACGGPAVDYDGVPSCRHGPNDCQKSCHSRPQRANVGPDYHGSGSVAVGASRSGSAESGDCGDGLANCCGTCFTAGDDDEERKEAVAIAFTWGDADCRLVY